MPPASGRLRFHRMPPSGSEKLLRRFRRPSHGTEPKPEGVGQAQPRCSCDTRERMGGRFTTPELRAWRPLRRPGFRSAHLWHLAGFGACRQRPASDHPIPPPPTPVGPVRWVNSSIRRSSLDGSDGSALIGHAAASPGADRMTFHLLARRAACRSRASALATHQTLHHAPHPAVLVAWRTGRSSCL